MKGSGLAVAAIAVVAYAACDLLHEVLGHGVATLLVPGVHALTLSTVALSTSASSRLVAAAGSIANLIAGLATLAFLSRGRVRGNARYFLWLFGSLNLLNATGYLMYSGLLGYGDWAVVVAGLKPPLAWRAALVAAGITTYTATIRVAASLLARIADPEIVRSRAVHTLVMPAYIAGGLLLVAGAIPNPAGAILILSSGASSGFGAMAGLLFVPGLVERRGRGDGDAASTPRITIAWTVAAIVTAAVFIFVVGPGIRLATG